MATPMNNSFSDFHKILRNSLETIPFIRLNVVLSKLLSASSTGNDRARMDQTFITDLKTVIEACKDQPVPENTECAANCYRLCRNLCATCVDNQKLLHDSPTFIELTQSLISNCAFCDTLSEDKLALLRCSVQFLGNYCSGNKTNQIQTWQTFHKVFRLLLQREDTKLREYVLMVIHITLTDPSSVLTTPPADEEWQLLQTCVQVTSNTDSENGLLVVEDCWKVPGFCDNSYSKMSLQSRTLMLEVLISVLKRLPGDDLQGVDGEVMEAGSLPACDNIHYVAATFILQSRLIPSLSSSTADHLQVLCTVKELECLCIASACHRLYGSLQDNDQLIKTAISLLQCIDDIGKQGDNVFTNVSKISNLREVNTDHPVFGLKRDLIRLLGNMAYKHRHNQDLIRELDGLPLILDQTNIDGKNPFITQWSVFAIHNLTEGNAENKRYIADLKPEGVAPSQEVLDDMGLSAETDGNKVVIKKKT